MNELITDDAVCRKAPATPGQLMTQQQRMRSMTTLILSKIGFSSMYLA